MKSSIWWVVAGAFSVVTGMLAFIWPLGATLAVNALAGWGFLIVGAVQLIAIFTVTGAGNKLWAALWGALGIYLGISLLANPLAGVLTLTLAIGVLFLATGISRLFYAYSLRNTKALFPVLLSGLVSLVLGVIVLASYPAAAPWLLGTLLAVDLIFNGLALIALGFWGRRIGEAIKVI